MKRDLLLLFLFFFLGFVKETYAQEAKVLIINQIRGGEKCCLPGNDKMIEMIRNNSRIRNLSFGWAIRFDALDDDALIDSLKNYGEVGLLLEITPGLVEASGLVYKGKQDGSDWYYAENSFLIGYTKEERKKLIDQLFNTFKKKFGFYPSFTAGWMIDGWSLIYIHTNYGVVLHELTKEQYETDSYTLYGGVFNFPYYPSILHPLVPSFGKYKLDIVMVRQTISDLLKNYGSPLSFYTSQPNDYLSSKEGLDNSYFQQLIGDALNQSPKQRFAVLGFENSFTDSKFLDEFQKQLIYISKLNKNNRLKVFKPSEYASWFSKEFPENPNFIFKKDFQFNKETGALWYFGKNYRARLVIKNEKVILDDLRIYPNSLDPYVYNPANTDYSYWIIPYLIDGSQQYSLTEKEIAKKFKDLIGDNTAPDFLTEPFGIVLGEGKFNLDTDEDTSKIVFTKASQGSVLFMPENIIIDRRLNPYLNNSTNDKLSDLMTAQKTVISFVKQFDFVITGDKNHSYLGWERNEKFVGLARLEADNEHIRITPITSGYDISLLNPLFQPDRSGLTVDPVKSIFYWNNKTAIAGRNPIRLFILPLNNLGRPTQVKKVEVTSPDINKLEVVYPDDYSFRIKPWFIDMKAGLPFRTDISIKIDGMEVIKDVSLEFVIDCRDNIFGCLGQPKDLIKYFIQLLGEQKRKFDGVLSNIQGH